MLKENCDRVISPKDHSQLSLFSSPQAQLRLILLLSKYVDTKQFRIGLFLVLFQQLNLELSAGPLIIKL